MISYEVFYREIGMIQERISTLETEQLKYRELKNESTKQIIQTFTDHGYVCENRLNDSRNHIFHYHFKKDNLITFSVAAGYNCKCADYPNNDKYMKDSPDFEVAIIPKTGFILGAYGEFKNGWIRSKVTPDAMHYLIHLYEDPGRSIDEKNDAEPY